MTRGVGSALTTLLIATALFAAAGCRGEGDDVLVEVERPGDLFLVVDRADRPLARAAVVRVTHRWIVALAALPSERPSQLFLRVGEERLPAVLRPCEGGLTVVEVRRGDRIARPFGLVTEVPDVQSVRVRLPGEGEFASGLTASESGDWLLDEVSTPEPWLGGVVLHGARLLGFVTGIQRADGDEEGHPQVEALEDSLPRIIGRVCASPGADCLSPGDGFAALQLAVRVPAKLPAVADDWGEADFFLSLDRAEDGLPLARIRLVPGRSPPPRTVAIPALGPLEARLVERDVSLADGIVDTPLAPSQVIDPRAGVVRLRFPLKSGELVSLGVRLQVLDPDRASGLDRTLLGANAIRIGDVAQGSLSLSGGDATDLWRFDARNRAKSAASPDPEAAPGDLLLLAFRADPEHVALEGWSPGSDKPLWRLPPAAGAPRLVAVRLDSGGRRQWVRARHERVRGPKDRRLGIPTSYAFAIARRLEPMAQAGLILELLVGEARREGSPYMSPRSLAREALHALNEVGGASREELTAAFLPALGHPEPAARLLVLELMSGHLNPDPLALERLRRGARGAARRTDAGLLLVARCRGPRRLAEVELRYRLAQLKEDDAAPPSELTPKEELARVWRSMPSAERQALLRAAGDALEEFLLRGAGDPLPEVRFRTVTLASKLRDSALRLRLRERLEQRLHKDPSPRVRRALLTAFWSRN
ncbi:MAG: hypothetical protein JKY65_23275 [Planctomycetes bacterium]|nr:hypothetical protein [Planctomycetota bacterium]